MPAQRLPWIKLWEQAIDHPKVALLSDALFRTWIHVLVAGSQQPQRWQFASARHAAIASGRPVAHMRRLVEARLLDATDGGGLVVHDWRQWQQVYPSDVNRQPHREHSANTPRTLREDSAKTPRRLRRDRDRDKDRDGDGRRETTLPPGLDTRPALEMSRGGDVAASPAPATPPGQVSAGDEALLAPLLDAFDALGLKRPKLTGFEPRDAAELLQHFEPLTIARCWQDIAAGAWGDEWDRRHLSFKLLASHNRLENWQREREADAVVADDLVGDVDVVRV